jgi:hypothetical protein
MGGLACLALKALLDNELKWLVHDAVLHLKGVKFVWAHDFELGWIQKSWA